jgi:putative NADH-flavin reductase
MPVIIIGADAASGREITDALIARTGEVRVFVTDRDAVRDLKERGVKVAVGDVSDGSHVGAAAAGCFSAVVIAAAEDDGRERSFATSPTEVRAAWAEALEDAAVSRIIWIGKGEPPRSIAMITPDVTAVDPARGDLAAEVLRLDDRA